MPGLARTILSFAAMVLLLIQSGRPAAAADLATSLAKHSQLSKFHLLINSAGLANLLRSTAGLTLLAPTNHALAAAPDYIRAAIKRGPGAANGALLLQLRHLVRGHVFDVILPPKALIGRRQQFTDADGTVRIIDGAEAGVITISTVPIASSAAKGGMRPRPQTAQVFGRAITADNGIIYPIDAILAD